MATITSNDESLAERDEVLFPNTDMVDTEPHYKNFTAIQNALRHRVEHRPINITTHSRSHSSDDQYRAVRAHVEPSSLRHYHSNETLYINTQPLSNNFTVPINIQSKKIDGHIFNLIKIVEDIGYNKNTPFIRSSSNPNIKNVSALLNIILKMGGAHGPLVNVWRSRIGNDYFERWYLEKYYQRSASLTQHKTMNNVNEQTTQNTPTHDYRSNININHSVSTKLPNKQMINDKSYDREIRQIFGFDDMDTTSSVSTYSSTSEIYLQNNQQSTLSTTSSLKINNNNNDQNPQTKPHVTMREHHPTNEVNQSISTKQINTNQHILNDNQQLIHNHPDLHNEPNPEIITKLNPNHLTYYQQFIKSHPDLNNDPNPEIITKSNPNHVTYQQNVSVRYLVPPTPPPPGPLIIREIVPPRPRSPSPLIVTYQEPSPPTPPPLILREAPPPPPPHQETTVITKVLPPESQSSRRVVVEQSAPLPQKPQSIIIEKWLPYKPAPPREVIYERVTEQPMMSEFEPAAMHIDRPRRHSAEFKSVSSRVSIPVDAYRQSSVDYIEKDQITEQPTGTFEQLAWTTHQQILAMQQRGKEQVQAHRQWAANQWQQHANMVLQHPGQLTTPSLTVYHQPVTTSYVQSQGYQQPVTTSYVQTQGYQQPVTTSYVQTQGYQQPVTTSYVQAQGYQQPVTTSYEQTQEYRQRVLYNPTFVFPFY